MNREIISIASAIGGELVEIERARSVLQAAIEPLEYVHNPTTAEEKMFAMQDENTVNLLHVTNSLLFRIHQELWEAQDSLYSIGREKGCSTTKRFIENDTYFSFDSSGEIIESMHENGMWDLMADALGICFQTEEEAKEHEGEVLKKLGLAEWPERK